jgi:hypothetical protein
MPQNKPTKAERAYAEALAEAKSIEDALEEVYAKLDWLSSTKRSGLSDDV